jgi:ribosome assembly protein 1
LPSLDSIKNQDKIDQELSLNAKKVSAVMKQHQVT